MVSSQNLENKNHFYFLTGRDLFPLPKLNMSKRSNPSSHVKNVTDANAIHTSIVKDNNCYIRIENIHACQFSYKLQPHQHVQALCHPCLSHSCRCLCLCWTCTQVCQTPDQAQLLPHRCLRLWRRNWRYIHLFNIKVIYISINKWTLLKNIFKI